MKQYFTLFVFLIITASALIKLNFIEEVEFHLIEQGFFNWKTTPIFVRFILLLEFFAASQLLFGFLSHKNTKKILHLLFSIYLLDLIFTRETGISYDATLFTFHHYLLSYLLLPVVIAFSIFTNDNLLGFELSKKVKRWINLGTFILIGGLVFLFCPIYIEDYEQNNNKFSTNKLDWNYIYQQLDLNNITLTDEEDVFMAFFSTSCPYCNRSARQLGASSISRKSSKKIVLIFPGNKEDTENFIQRNNCNFPFIRIPKDEFRKYIGISIPVFYSLKKKTAYERFTGNSFNYPELDKLFP